MEWWNNVIRGLGTANAPFGFAPVDSPSQGQVDPAYNAGMQMLGNVGMGMLASGEKNPMTALGKSYLVASRNAQQQNKDQYVAAKMLEEADAKKQERARSEEERKRRQEYIQQFPADVQVKMLSIPGYMEKYIEATDPAFQQPKDEKLYPIGGRLVNGQGQVVYDGGGAGQGDLPKGYRWNADGTAAEPIPGVTVPGTPKPYTPNSTDRTAIRNAKEENALLEQTLVNLDEASGLVNDANSGYFATSRAAVAENLPDGIVPDNVFGSPKQGASTLRLKQIMDAEALASMGKLLKGPTSDRDVRIMLETVNDPNASPKRKQESIDQVKRIIRAQIAANQENIEFSMNGPNATGGPITTEDGITIEEIGQ